MGTEDAQELERQLRARHAAAIQLVRAGRDVDRLLLLSYVVWPTAALRATPIP